MEAVNSYLMAGSGAPSRDEEAREYLQTRLILMSKLMFWSFVTLLAFMVTVYTAYPDYQPRLNSIIYALSAVGMLLLALLWRGVLMRRRLDRRQLEFIDVFYVVGTGSIFGASGALAYDLRPSAYICMTFAVLLVVLRATVVPSTGVRTALVSTAACLPMAIGTIVVVYTGDQDVPGPAYVGGAVLVFALGILLATAGSNVLYGLRKRVNEAMQLGVYTLDRKVGQGGNGAVYRAHHALLRRPTAIKVIRQDRKMSSETLDRFEREVQLMSQLTHASTVTVFDYGRSPDGLFYYAMEYLDGIDLEKLVTRFGAQPVARVVPILIQVCGALAEAHRRGLIHRDVKPANVIISERGDVPDVAKVVDFGLVKEIASNDSRMSRGVLGTPDYIAPETITDPSRVGPATDLYGLGAVGFYLVTGRRLFDGNTDLDVCLRHVRDEPPVPSQHSKLPIPAELDAVILACLAKNPAHRPATAGELAAALRAVPLGMGWSETEAARWWDEFRRLQRVADVDQHARTVTIDLSQRLVGQST